MIEKCASAHPSPILTSLPSTTSLQSFYVNRPIVALMPIKMQ